jgi:hypothetical protein
LSLRKGGNVSRSGDQTSGISIALALGLPNDEARSGLLAAIYMVALFSVIVKVARSNVPSGAFPTAPRPADQLPPPFLLKGVAPDGKSGNLFRFDTLKLWRQAPDGTAIVRQRTVR